MTKTDYRNRAAYFEGCYKLSILRDTITIVLQGGQSPKVMFRRVFHSATRAHPLSDLVLFRRAFEWKASKC